MSTIEFPVLPDHRQGSGVQAVLSAFTRLNREFVCLKELVETFPLTEQNRLAIMLDIVEACGHSLNANANFIAFAVPLAAQAQQAPSGPVG